MPNQKIKQAVEESIREVLTPEFVPFDTGNLLYNAIEVDIAEDGSARIDFNERIAPYVVDLQESGPHKGFIDRLTREISTRIAAKLGANEEEEDESEN